MSNLREQRDVLDDLIEAQEEREAAYAVREKDPERWRVAKHGYAAKRRFWREAADYRRAVLVEEQGGEGNAVVHPASVDTPGKALSPLTQEK